MRCVNMPSVRTHVLLTRPVSSRRRATSFRCNGGKGFGKQSIDTHNNAKQTKKEQPRLEENERMEPVDVLKQFHMSPDKNVVAAKYADELTEKFFVVTDAMLKLAIKEGNKAMKTEYMLILQAAMDERQKRLRPEIRLLNELMMGSTTPEERREKISSSKTAEVIVRDKHYFFSLLEGMKQDLRQREGSSEDQAEVMALLDDIERDCRGRAQVYETSGK